MDKLTIHIRRYRADIIIIGEKLVESNQKTIDNYTEEKSLMNVEDVGSTRQRFIEEAGRSVYNYNQNREREALRKRSSSIEKLIIYKIV